MINNKLAKTTAGLGVKKIETENADFDTDFMRLSLWFQEWVTTKREKVIDCVQSGYTMNDEVIRHAKVAVGQ